MKGLFIVKNFSNDGFGGTRRILGVAKYLSSLPNVKLKFLTENYLNKQYLSIIPIKTPKFLQDRYLSINNVYKAKTNKIKNFNKSYLYYIPSSVFKILFKDFKFIYCTCPVFSNMQIGYLYKLFHPDSKLIIEYRDLHSLNPIYSNDLNKRIARYIELKILKKADLIITTTFGMKNVIMKLIPSAKIKVVHNYISENDSNKNIQPYIFNSNYYHIGYIGTLNTGRDPIEIKEILDLKINNKKIIFHFVGNSHSQEIYIKNKLGNNGNIIFHGVVSREESLNYMKSMDALYLIIHPEMKLSDGYGIPGKLFDYIAMKNVIVSNKECFNKLESEIQLKSIYEENKYIFFSSINQHYLEEILSNALKDIIN
jgi:hypothetical protein